MELCRTRRPACDCSSCERGPAAIGTSADQRATDFRNTRPFFEPRRSADSPALSPSSPALPFLKGKYPNTSSKRTGGERPDGFLAVSATISHRRCAGSAKSWTLPTQGASVPWPSDHFSISEEIAPASPASNGERNLEAGHLVSRHSQTETVVTTLQVATQSREASILSVFPQTSPCPPFHDPPQCKSSRYETRSCPPTFQCSPSLLCIILLLSCPTCTARSHQSTT